MVASNASRTCYNSGQLHDGYVLLSRQRVGSILTPCSAMQVYIHPSPASMRLSDSVDVRDSDEHRKARIYAENAQALWPYRMNMELGA